MTMKSRVQSLTHHSDGVFGFSDIVSSPRSSSLASCTGVKPTATFSNSAEGAVVNCLPVVPVKLPNVCMGVPAADRLGLRRRRRTFVHKSYLLRWVRASTWHPAALRHTFSALQGRWEPRCQLHCTKAVLLGLM